MKQRMHLHTSEFAKACGVNRRTLHYYDEQGIFSPEHVEDNGYRSYSVRQLYPFIIIRMMRQMGLSLEEIKDYMARRSPENLQQLLAEQEKWIDEQLAMFRHMKRSVQNQRRLLDGAGDIICGIVQRQHFPARALYLSRPLHALILRGDENGIERITMELLRTALARGIDSGYAVGGRTARADFMMPGHEYLSDRYFMATDVPYQRLPREQRELRPEGDYIVTYFRGDYMDTESSYALLREYLAAHRDIGSGPYSYEESIIDELSAASQCDYITRVAIQIVPSER